jgi:glucose-6-phosphate 1-dehydrogenase
MTNPFAEGESRILKPPATAVVIFGASGDLTVRKLIPALYNLSFDDYLPADFVVVGSARTKMSDEEFRAKLKDGLQKFSRRPLSDEVWARFSNQIFYQPLDGNRAEDFVALKNRLESLGAGRQLNYLYYLAVSPEFFAGIAKNLRQVGLVEDPLTSSRRTALVVEKPFGTDLASAKSLNAELMNYLSEDQIFRIDHYLGKETVQNILVFRFANGIFEPLWNNKYVESIEISVCEEIGVGNRAGYFDQNGITRDIIQNHVLQMLSLLCIEPPISLSNANSIRDEKVKVLKNIRRYTTEEAAKNSVRAQYTTGFIDGSEVPGYRQEQGISATSTTDTYAAVRLEIDNWRWKGVPIYIRAGKRLPKRITDITVLFKRAPDSLFKGRDVDNLEPNALTIQVQPKEGMTLRINSKPPGPRMRVKPVEMDFTYNSSFGVASSDAYERLLLDAMRGDSTLFTRNDEIEESWALLAPFFEAWQSESLSPVHEYQAGSWGPKAASELLKPRGHRWRRL